MKDSMKGGLLAFTIAGPVVVICCGGKAILAGSLFGGALGFLTGVDVLGMVLLAAVGGIVILLARNLIRARRQNAGERGSEKDVQIEQQTS